MHHNPQNSCWRRPYAPFVSPTKSCSKGWLPDYFVTLQKEWNSPMLDYSITHSYKNKDIIGPTIYLNILSLF